MNFDILNLAKSQQEMAANIASLTQLNTIDASRDQKILAIYQNNLLMNGVRSLSISYPVIQKMLGASAMRTLAKRLLQLTLPSHGDWGEWGSQLDMVLDSSELIDELPFLSELARLEWQIHQCSRAASVPFNHEDLLKINNHSLNDVVFLLQPHVSIMESEFPIAALWQAHRPWDTGFMPNTKSLAAILSTAAEPNFCLVYQNQYQAKVEPISEEQYKLIRAIQKITPLSALVNEFGDKAIAEWLADSVDNNLIQRIQ